MVFSQFSLLSYFHHVNCCLPPINRLHAHEVSVYRQKHSLCFYVKPFIVAAALHLQGESGRITQMVWLWMMLRLRTIQQISLASLKPHQLGCSTGSRAAGNAGAGGLNRYAKANGDDIYRFEVSPCLFQILPNQSGRNSLTQLERLSESIALPFLFPIPKISVRNFHTDDRKLQL